MTTLVAFDSVALQMTQESRPTITPLPGESLTSATFRQLDPFHGSGLSATDQAVIVSQERHELRRSLFECTGRCADLLIERRAHVATIRRLQHALVQANELIASLQEKLEDAQCAALSAQGQP